MEPRRGAMHHVGPLALAIGVDVLDLEALRHIEVELDGGQLPFPPEGVLHLEVDFRTVEGARRPRRSRTRAPLSRWPFEATRWPDPNERDRPPAPVSLRLRGEVGLNLLETEGFMHREGRSGEPRRSRPRSARGCRRYGHRPG